MTLLTRVVYSGTVELTLPSPKIGLIRPIPPIPHCHNLLSSVASMWMPRTAPREVGRRAARLSAPASIAQHVRARSCAAQRGSGTATGASRKGASTVPARHVAQVAPKGDHVCAHRQPHEAPRLRGWPTPSERAAGSECADDHGGNMMS